MSDLTRLTPPMAFSLSHAEAAEWNKRIMGGFQAALESNPEADLLSMFPDSYRREHRLAQYSQESQLSYAAKLNLRTLHELREMLRSDPEINMLSAFPINYNRRIKMSTDQLPLPSPERDIPEPRSEFQTRLDIAETARVLFPLSSTVTALTANSPQNCSNDEEKTLATPLKQLLRSSPKLWESPARGMVVRCSESIVAKVVYGNKDSTEYTSMQFLAEQAPDFPAPRPHGMVALGPFSVLFMSYVPGITLAQAWPTLSHSGKLSIQQQLTEIFHRLRSLPIPNDSQSIGGVCGEGAKEPRINVIVLFNDIRTPQQFSDLQFSARHHGSNTYVEFLRSFLWNEDPSMLRPVFTHGDVRTANIMVEQDPDAGVSHYTITGVIDWEDSGFYPAYYESLALTRTQSLVDEDDWYLHLPKCISPSEFPIRWLVDRLWGIHIRTT